LIILQNSFELYQQQVTEVKLDPPFTHCSEQNLETSISPLVPELSSDNIQCSLSCLSVASVDLLASPVKKQNKTKQINDW